MKLPDFRSRKDQRGAVLVVTAFAFIGLLGVAALVVNIVNVHQAEIRAQATADAAALAAGQDIDNVPAALAAVVDYAARNFGVTAADWAACVDDGALAVTTSLPCVSIDDADNPTFLRVQVPDHSVPSFFASVVGHDSFSVSASATVEATLFYTAPDVATPDDEDPATTNLRDGDPGGGFPPCDVIPDWDEGLPSSTTTTTDPSATTTTDPLASTTTTKKDKKKGSKDGGSVKWSEFIFVYEHTDGTTTTVCGTTLATGGGNETWVPEAGGMSATEPSGMFVHVSCSANFSTGWSNKKGPEEFIDTEWRIVRYTIDKYEATGEGVVTFDRRCGDEFVPVPDLADPPPPQVSIRLSD